MATDSDRPVAHATLTELIDRVAVWMLVTRRPDGALRGLPVAHVPRPFEGQIWLFADPTAAPLLGADQPMPVHLSHAEVPDCRYVSISGTIQSIPDRELARQLWRPSYSEWLPRGLPDPSHGLFCVVVQHAEYWDASHSVMRQVGGLMRGVFTGQRPAVGDHESLDFPTPGSES